MGIKVAKFGGSSLANSQQFKKVHSIILSDPDRCYIVPSAPGKRNPEDKKITDLLYLCSAHVQQEIPFDDIFNIIEERFKHIVEKLDLTLDLTPYLKQIKDDISNGESADYTASRGEYINGLILSEYLKYDFIDAKDVILFDENGRLNEKATKKALQDCFKLHPRAVIPGFYGSMPDGKIKTFPRGGSDITGSIVACGINADVYENWTDVSGFLMADPHIVKDPMPIETITYRELRELAYMGAKVLQEESILPVRRRKIPINIRNTNCPEHPGTMIVDRIKKIKNRKITGIAGKKNFTVIAIEKDLMNSRIDFVRRIFSVLEDNDVTFERLPSGIDTMSIVISDNKLETKLDTILEEIKDQCKPDTLDVYPNMALIATVGQGMIYKPGMAAELFNALYKSHINIRMIDQGSSEINIIVGVENDDFERAIRAIYNTFTAYNEVSI